MKINRFFILLGCVLLAGCATQTYEPNAEPNAETSTSLQAEAYNMSKANVALAEAAGSVSQSLTQLGATEQAANPPESVNTPPSPASYGMSMPTSIDWNGPVQPIVQQIANATHYQLQVLGKAPAIPIIVSIQAKNEPMGNILRDIGYQSSNRASIIVFPSRQIVELRYENT